jgi:hypothetical protein
MRLYCKDMNAYQMRRECMCGLLLLLLLLRPQGDEDGLVAEVSRMVSCSDFHPSMLHVSVRIAGCT